MGTDTSWEWGEGLGNHQERGLRLRTGRRGRPYGSLSPLAPHPAWAPASCVTWGTARPSLSLGLLGCPVGIKEMAVKTQTCKAHWRVLGRNNRDVSYHLLRTSPSSVFFSCNPRGNLRCGPYYRPHFTEENTEAQRGEEIARNSTVYKWLVNVNC